MQPSDSTGAGRSLPPSLLIIATISSLVATILSLFSIYTHLKRYLKPHLQRHVIRLILIVPIYSTSSLIGLFSLPAAFLIDLLRDLYEAFAIYSFFELLVAYLGGERSTLILLVGRKPIDHPWPFKLILRELDLSDPYTFLSIKRGVLQYVQIKPILAASTVILKSFGKYQEGEFKANNGYTYISTVYNISIFLSLYCLALFWTALSQELAPFRPTSKFLTVKGVVFATFWQGWAISVLVAAGAVKSIGPISDPDFLRLGLQDLLLTLEMPLFALGHMYAFSPRDYVDSWATHQARLPILFALRDALGGRDVTEDIKGTMRGTGYGYARFEPARGAVHQGVARSRRLHAGLRYTQGGKGKYFLPSNGLHTTNGGNAGGGVAPLVEGSRVEGPFAAMRRWMEDKRMRDEGYAPLSAEEAAEVIHPNSDQEDGSEEERGGNFLDPLRPNLDESGTVDGKTQRRRKAEGAARRLGYQLEAGLLFFSDHPDRRGYDGDSDISLEFHSPPSNPSEEEGYAKARRLDYGDYAFPTIPCHHAGHIDEERGRGEQEALLGRWRGKSGSGSRERRKRVEGWLERMRNAIAREESDEEEEAIEAETDAHRDSVEVSVKGKKRSGVGASGGRKKAKQGEKDANEGSRRSVWGGWAEGDEADGDHDQRESTGKGEADETPKAGDQQVDANVCSSSSPPSSSKGRSQKMKSTTAPASKSSLKKKTSISSKFQENQAASNAEGEAGAVDLIISDPAQEEREMARERRRGDLAARVGGGDALGGRGKKRVFRKVWSPSQSHGPEKASTSNDQIATKVDDVRDGQEEEGERQEGVVMISDEPPPAESADAVGQVAVQVDPPIVVDAVPSPGTGSEDSSSSSSQLQSRQAEDSGQRVGSTQGKVIVSDGKNKTSGDIQHGRQPERNLESHEEDSESDRDDDDGNQEHQMPVYQRHDWTGDDSVDGGRNPWT